MAPGTPAGSSALSGFENYNPFSGGFSAALPLYHVGGRGEAGFDLMWSFQQTWVAAKRYGGVNPLIPINLYPDADISGTSNVLGMLGAGAVFVRTGSNFISCPNTGNATGSTLARVVFEAPNGTQIELIDQNTNGAVYNLSNACSQSAGSLNAGRGTLFRSDDGSGIVFVADAPVMDTLAPGFGEADTKVSGTLRFPNGVAYRVDKSDISWVEDRNGNRTVLQYNSGLLQAVTWYLTVDAPSTIIDPLGRSIQIKYNDSTCSGCTTITTPGMGGAPRVIKIMQAHLSQGLLRDSGGVKTLDQLFPGTGQPTTYNFDPLLANSILFPDGRMFSFQYDEYGELARVNLPAAGAVEYDYGDGYNGKGDGFQGSASDTSPVMVYRRLQERREYAAGGSAWTSKTHYTVSYPGANTVDTEVVYDPAENVAGQTVHTMNGSPRDVLQMTGTGCNSWSEGLEVQTDWGAPQPVRTVKNAYVAQSGCMNSPQLASRTTILHDTNQQSQVTFSYDQYNNVTERKDYDWGSGTPGALLRDVQTAYEWATYSAYGAPSVNLVRLPFFSTVVDGHGGQIAQTVWHYDENTPTLASGIPGHDDANEGTGFNTRGNMTKLLTYVSTGGGSIGTSFTYDVAGNLLSETDPMNHTTYYSYADPQNTDGFLTGVQNALGQTASAGYDFSTGNLVQTMDRNNVVTKYAYESQADRLQQVWRVPGGGGSVEGQTNYSYSPSFNEVSVTEDQNQVGDKKLGWARFSDGLGRLSAQVVYENPADASQTITVRTDYNALGEPASVSNPARPNETSYATATLYDTLGRAVRVRAQDGAVTQMSYTGNQVTVTDPANHAKTYSYDALGRLTVVVEDPGGGGLNYQTSYLYDELDDVTSVSQGVCPGAGCQTRTFTYDSMRHLLTAKNPESCTTTYTYDYEGKRQTETDARGSRITYSYDALHRVTGKSYDTGTVPAGCAGAAAAAIAGTPQVKFTYDQGGANSVGQLTQSEAVGQSLTSYSNFDALGRPGQSYQNTNSLAYTMQYKYNLSGAVTSETYPSGRVVSDSYDAVNRVTQVWGAFNGQTASYVASLSYAAQGGPLKMAYGNQVVQTTNYNPQLQVSGLWDAVGDNPNNFLFLENPIGWGGTDNNGTLRSLTLYEGGPAPSTNLAQFTQSFTYDAVNRLKTAADSGGWSRTYSYDPFGNRTVSAQGLAANEAPSAFTLTNQISGGSYDAAGHQLATGGNGLAYDGEGRLSQISEPASWGGAQLTYYYDGEGRRVEKLVNGAAASIYVYDALGQMITEDSPNGSVGTAPCQTCYLSVDHLGSTRLVTDANGHLMALHDYLPFGDEVPPDNRVGRDGRWGPGNDNITQKFTGKERGETNLDYFGARYYAGALGRFTSPDPGNAGADLYNPQSWNGYSYAANDPMDNVDPSGLSLVTFLDGLFRGGVGRGGGGGGTAPTFSVTGYGAPYGSPSDSWFGGGLFGGGGGPVGGAANSSGRSGGGGGGGYRFSVTHSETSSVQSLLSLHGAPPKTGSVTCSSVLPNGRTIGSYVQQYRAQLQAIAGEAVQTANMGRPSNPLGEVMGAFYPIAKSNGPIDFKNNFRGSANSAFLGQAGNFAYYAVGSGILPDTVLDAGAGAYAIYSTFRGQKNFSTLTGPMFSDASAASVRNAGLNANGCGS